MKARQAKDLRPGSRVVFTAAWREPWPDLDGSAGVDGGEPWPGEYEVEVGETAEVEAGPAMSPRVEQRCTARGHVVAHLLVSFPARAVSAPSPARWVPVAVLEALP